MTEKVHGPTAVGRRLPHLDISKLAQNADTILAAGEIARKVYSPDPPDRDTARAVQRRARAEGVDLTFEHKLLDDGTMRWTVRIPTGRGTVEATPVEGQSWQELFEELGL